ncbi:hypothetical protein [Paenibacillus sp. 2KB_22]|uniref:hypothetical protein n=1 Tax=Paenibacillus sp. 2KB_22 TaxID=3232978 RepID=UPI003F9E8418
MAKTEYTKVNLPDNLKTMSNLSEEGLEIPINLAPSGFLKVTFLGKEWLEPVYEVESCIVKSIETLTLNNVGEALMRLVSMLDDKTLDQNARQELTDLKAKVFEKLFANGQTEVLGLKKSGTSTSNTLSFKVGYFAFERPATDLEVKEYSNTLARIVTPVRGHEHLLYTLEQAHKLLQRYLMD